MQKQLDTSYDVAGTIQGQEVDSFGFNVTDKLIHIGYSTLENPTTPNQTDLPYTLQGVDYTGFITRLNELAPGASTALIQTCLEFLPGDGTIS